MSGLIWVETDTLMVFLNNYFVNFEKILQATKKLAKIIQHAKSYVRVYKCKKKKIPIGLMAM